ncbi:MAG: SIS domain-containing protein [Patescibacteria group bacterium]
MPQDMREVILASPQQIGHSLEVNKDVKVEGKVDSIVLAGMGGSGHPGDLLNALGISNVPLYVHRNYDLPTTYLAHMGLVKPLVIASSYSGNTEEPLTGYALAQRESRPLLVSASGGKLQELAQRDGTPFIKIDYTDMQPRHTLFAAFAGIYAALRNSGLVENIDEDLRRVEKVLIEKAPLLEAPGKELAQKIKGKTAVYLSTDALGFATKNFKIQTNENAKYPAFWNTFPEMNHNEMLGFSKLKEMKNPNQFFVLTLRDKDDHPRNRARIEVTTGLYRDWGVTVEHVNVEGTTLLEKLMYTVTLGLWTTYFLALEYGIDPVPVEGVESLKAKLKEVAGDI